jgi:hypothetical protein
MFCTSPISPWTQTKVCSFPITYQFRRILRICVGPSDPKVAVVSKPKRGRKKKSTAQSDTIDAASKTATKNAKPAPVVSCPVCLQVPLHFRYQCPIIMAGSESLQKRLDELKLEDPSEARTQLIEELGSLLTRMLLKRGAKPQNTKTTNTTSPKDKSESPQRSAQTSASTTPSLEFLIPSRPSTSRAVSTSRKSDEEETVQNVAQTRSAFEVSAPSRDSELEAIVRGPKTSKNILDQINSSSEEENEMFEDVISEEEHLTRQLPRARDRRSTSSADDGEIFGHDTENAQSSLLDTTSPVDNHTDSNAVSLTATTWKTDNTYISPHASDRLGIVQTKDGASLRSPRTRDLPGNQLSSITKQNATPSTPGPIIIELGSSPIRNHDIAVREQNSDLRKPIKTPLSPSHRAHGANGGREPAGLARTINKAQGTQSLRSQVKKTPAMGVSSATVAKSKKHSSVTPSASNQTQRTLTPSMSTLTKIANSPIVYELSSESEGNQKAEATKKTSSHLKSEVDLPMTDFPAFPDSDMDLKPENLSSSHSAVSTSRYRKLTDIAKQHRLFDAPSTASWTSIQQTSEKNTEQEEEEEESSDSSVEFQSHIPPSRRATRTPRKTRGLLSHI